MLILRGGSYGVVAADQVLVFVQQILEGDAVNVVVDGLLKARPEFECRADGASLALVLVVLEAGYRRQTALCCAEDIPYSIVLRRVAQLVAAVVASGALQESCTLQQRYYLLHVFDSDALPF